MTIMVIDHNVVTSHMYVTAVVWGDTGERFTHLREQLCAGASMVRMQPFRITLPLRTPSASQSWLRVSHTAPLC